MTTERPASPHVDFIDWLKCLGIILILYGHLAGWAPLAALPPIYTKQLGVALFLFVAGYSLARESRDRWRVAFNRLFEVFLLGLLTALIMSAVTFAREGRLQLSNYAPLAGGVNVLFNFFPANPTTWFLGTYFHVIALWAMVGHRIRVTVPVLILCLGAEVAIRVVLMRTAGLFVAYMALSNWLTVLLLGYWYGQHSRRSSHGRSVPKAAAWTAVFILLILGWSVVAAALPFQWRFPFMQLGAGDLRASVLVSVAVSLIYLGATWMVFLIVSQLRAPAPVRFLAANTLVIFLAHMPIYFELQPVLRQFGLSRSMTSIILMILCTAGLGWLSRELHRGGWIRNQRDRIFGRKPIQPAPHADGQ